MEKQSEENNKKSEPFYTERSKRTKDITLGAVGGFFYVVVSFAALMSFRIIGIYSWLFFIIYLLLISFFIFKKKHYISIGLIAIVVIPFAIIGGCLALMGI